VEFRIKLRLKLIYDINRNGYQLGGRTVVRKSEILDNIYKESLYSARIGSISSKDFTNLFFVYEMDPHRNDRIR